MGLINLLYLYVWLCAGMGSITTITNTFYVSVINYYHLKNQYIFITITITITITLKISILLSLLMNYYSIEVSLKFFYVLKWQ